MDEFGFWQRWGLELNDQQFANAFLVLGVFAASSPGQYRSSSARDLQDGLAALVRQAEHEDTLLAWRFPKPDQSVPSPDAAMTLAELDPRQTATLWTGTAADMAFMPAPRLQIGDYPVAEAVRPWFRLLFETSPCVKAAHIAFEAAAARPSLEWPLRLGFLPDNAGPESLEIIRSSWPASELARIVRIDRENANCDVLLFTGSSSQLLRALLEMPGSQKTHLFIVRGTFEEDLAVARQRRAALAAEGRASGFVFVHPTTTETDLGCAVTRLVENLSHNQPVDVAVCEAFAQKHRTDPAVFLSPELAGFHLAEVLDVIDRRFRSLPRAMPIESKSLEMLALPAPAAARGLTNPETAADAFLMYRSTVDFRHEIHGARDVAKINKALGTAESQVTDKKQRFLQERVLIMRDGTLADERRAFHRGVPALIRVRIGPPEEKWGSLGKVFPEEELPPDQAYWRLTVVLTEFNHLKEGLRRSIRLPRYGPSTECEFRIQPGDYPMFEGRITVLHRGRILQTGVLQGRIVAEERDISDTDRISFVEILPVRARLDDLEGRRQFDLAFLMNHTTEDRPLVTAIAQDHAWLADISRCQEMTRDLNTALTDVANSVRDYQGGLASRENVQLLVRLAQIGRQLYGEIVLGQIRLPGNQKDFEKKRYIQIVSTRTDALMPLEFIYSAPEPDDKAELCPKMKAVVSETDQGARTSKAKELIETICQRVDGQEIPCEHRTAAFVCPLAFWGTSKVIERHMANPLLAQPGKDFFLQCCETTTARGMLEVTGTAVVAASQKVTPEMLSPVLSACADRLGSPPQEAQDWSNWVTLIRTYKPHLLLALPHTDGNGSRATLEIKGKLLSSGQITEDHVHAAGDTTYPLVALLGCDTAGTALDYGDYVRWFRWQGAALVISTIAKVFGGHAAAVAEQLVKELKQKTGPQERIGEIIRAIKRQALLDGSLMALCVVAFGDADWKLS